VHLWRRVRKAPPASHGCDGQAHKAYDGVSFRCEAEEVFFNRPVLLLDDVGHSAQERRYLVLGRTTAARALSVVFTVRGDLIRVISARPISRKERDHYAAIADEAP